MTKTQQITFTSDTYEAAYEGLRRHEIEHTVRFVAWSSPKFFGNSGKFSFTNIEIEHTVRFVAWSSPKFFGNSGKFSFTNIEHILKKVYHC